MKEQTVKELVKVVRESTESINALDYGRYDENAHTEFLATILRHRNGLFVKSFLAEVLDVAEDEICRHNIIDWLEQRVLPYCLNSETSLVASLKVYVEYLMRKTGGYAKRELAEMLKDDIFLDQSETAYNLKRVLKNNPTLRYMNMGHFDIGAFSSVGQFTYCGSKYVQCATIGKHPDVRMHIPCSLEGISTGLYIFSKEILQYGGAVVQGALESFGFVEERNIFRLKPTRVPKDLIELARSVEAAIRRIEAAVPQLAK